MNIIKKLLGFRESTLFFILLVVGIIMSFLSPYFLTAGNIKTTILSFAINGIVAIGMSIVLISGGIDLSVGSVMAFTGAITGAIFQVGGNIWIASLIGIIISMLIGSVNMFFITKIGLSPFITTLAMTGIARGVTYVVTKGLPLSLYSMPNNFKFLGSGNIGPIPFVIILFVLLIIVSDFMVRKSTIFRKVFYVGSNSKAAKFSGIRVNRTIAFVYILSSLLAGIAGILQIARFATATPSSSIGVEMQAISACVIGGASLAGGEGSILGSVFGIALLSVISSSLVLLNISVYWQELISGVILLLAVSIDYITHKK